MAVKKKPSKKTTGKGAKKKTSTAQVTKASTPLRQAQDKPLIATKRKKAAKKTIAKPKKVAKTKVKKAKKRRKPETLMCFLTTACVRYYDLQDDGYELNTLRLYRDNYLKSTASGKKLVKEYYKVSPEIVNHVERDENKSEVYSFIYNCVLKACKQIDQLKYPAARTTYKSMVENLLTRYNLSLQ